MKNRKYTKTELSKSPSEAIFFVRDGATLHVSYKSTKEPIPVISTSKKISKRSKRAFTYENLKHLIVSEPRFSNSAEYFHKERRKI